MSSLIPGWFGPSQPTQRAALRSSVVCPPSAAGTPGSPVSWSCPLEKWPQGPVLTP